MRIFFRNIFLLLASFLIMILVNESIRPTIQENPYPLNGITAMNSVIRFPDKCSWARHNDTRFCQNNHAPFMKSYFAKTDPIYYGVISRLKQTGDYQSANIFFFLVLFPLISWLFLIGGLRMNRKIKALKESEWKN